MSCANTTEWVSERLKGLLSADDERLLEAHLSVLSCLPRRSGRADRALERHARRRRRRAA